MPIGRPGILIFTDDAGTWTAGSAVYSINGNDYTQAWGTNKDTSMTALAAQLAADPDVDTAVYNSTAHTITCTPLIGKQLFGETDLSGVTGTMAAVTITTTPAYPTWATDPAAELNEPSSGEKAVGWIHDNMPPASWLNWLQNLVCGWLLWIDDFIGNHDVETTGEGDLTFSNNQFDTTKTLHYYWKKSVPREGKTLVELSFDGFLTAAGSTTTFTSDEPIAFPIRPVYAREIPVIVSDAIPGLGVMNIDGSNVVDFGVFKHDSGTNLRIAYSDWAYPAPSYKGVIQSVVRYFI